MKIRLGYVSIPVTLDHVTPSSQVTYTYYQKKEIHEANKHLDKVIQSNFSDLEKILYYNYQNEIHFYRLTSNLIPLITHPKVDYEVYKRYQQQFLRIGSLIQKYDIRVDVHPNAYCVLNSTKKEVVESSINILKTAYNMFLCMQIEGKIILHVGSGTYSKKAGMNRFIKHFRMLPKTLQRLIVLENDDKLYNASEVLMICEVLQIPMVLDYHHHICNPCEEKIEDLLDRIYLTWKKESFNPKMHFSSPKNKKEKRSHHDYINPEDFLSFLKILKEKKQDVDIMIEAKAKDEAMFRLIRNLKYHDIKVIGTSIIL